MLSNDKRLDVLYFKLFDDCNAKCNMCDCWLVPFTRRDVSYYINKLAEVIVLRPRSVRLTGGEPLLLKGVSSLVRCAVDTGARVSIITNGRLLRAKATVLADSGCAEVIVSLDGVEATHDLIRGTPGLFARCIEGITAVSQTPMAYGVNTVIQKAGIGDLPALADLLFELPKPPAWWHLIPVRDHAGILPPKAQQDRLPGILDEIRTRAEVAGVTVIADDRMFEGGAPSPCAVPTYAAYFNAETGVVYGCNMLAYADGVIGNVADGLPAAFWTGNAANELRQRCADGVNAACARCDDGSRQLNHFLRDLAIQHSNHPPALTRATASQREGLGEI